MSSRNQILLDRTKAATNPIANRSYVKPEDTGPLVSEEIATEAEIMKRIKIKVNQKFREKILSDAKNPEFIDTLKKTIDNLLQSEKAVKEVTQRNLLTQKIVDDILGFGPLQPLLEDDKVTEIMVSHFTKVYVERGGKLVLDPSIIFVDDEQLRNVIEKIVQPIGRRIDESDPLVDARLPDGSRVNATIPPISPDGCTLTIRKFAKNKLTGDNYLIFGSLSPAMIEFMEGAVIGRCNIIVSGGTGSGKTTLLNMLSNFCPSSDSIVTVEDSCELQLHQDNVRRLEAKPANSEGKGEIPIRGLVKNCLRMRPDRIIVGEIRDGAVVDMFRAMSSGHDGSLTTIHSNNPRDLVDSTIFILFGMSDMKFTEKAIQQLVCSAVDLIIQISRLADGTRKIINVTHVVGYGKIGASKLNIAASEVEKDKIYLQDIYRFVQTGVDEKGKIQGVYEATGYVPKDIIDKAKANRHVMSIDLFDKAKASWEAGKLPPRLQQQVDMENAAKEAQKQREEMAKNPNTMNRNMNGSNQMVYTGQNLNQYNPNQNPNQQPYYNMGMGQMPMQNIPPYYQGQPNMNVPMQGGQMPPMYGNPQ